MSFRKFGGLQYTSRNNKVSNNKVSSSYNTDSNLQPTEDIGRHSNYINFITDDISCNISINGNIDITGNGVVNGILYTNRVLYANGGITGSTGSFAYLSASQGITGSTGSFTYLVADNINGNGISGQVLTSNGSNSPPTWQNFGITGATGYTGSTG